MVRQYLLLLGSCFVAVACAHHQQPDNAFHQATIDQIRRQTEAAENAGSTERMRVHIAEDIVMMAPNMPAVTGADNTMQAMRAFFDTFNVQIQYDTEEIVVAGGWAFDRGIYKQRLTPKQGGQDLVESGKYLWVYRRDANGAWKQVRVIWNSSDPAPGGSPSN